MPPRRLRADWLLPMDGPPIRDGAVLLDSAGRIAALGPDADVPLPPDVPAEYFPDAVLLPGLINCHTHLELTGFAGQVPEQDFGDWIRRLRRLKEARGPEDFQAAAQQGLRNCHAAGVTTVADTGDSGAALRALADAGGSGVAYHEVFGPHPDQCADSLAGLQAGVEQLGRWAGGRARLGVSPHAPYSVSGPLYRAAAEWARAEGLPIAVHLAESPGESALLADGTGTFAAAWRARGIPLPGGGHSPVSWLDAHGVLGPTTLCIHVVQAGPEDIGRLAQRGVAVAHCPLSNRRHRHGAAPVTALLGAGIRLGVGTDSEASVAPPDLLAEVRAAQALAGLDATAALELVTVGAAAALGLSTEVGRLAPGWWGDVAVIRAAADDPREVAAAVLRTSPREVAATYLAGREVHRA